MLVCEQSLYFLRWSGAAILDYLASEIWGEDKTPLGTGGGARRPQNGANFATQKAKLVSSTANV